MRLHHLYSGSSLPFANLRSISYHYIQLLQLIRRKPYTFRYATSFMTENVTLSFLVFFELQVAIHLSLFLSLNQSHSPCSGTWCRGRLS
jgi:hypothetical protein